MKVLCCKQNYDISDEKLKVFQVDWSHLIALVMIVLDLNILNLIQVSSIIAILLFQIDILITLFDQA